MNNEVKKELGKFFVDIAKLLIGGVVLSSILKIQGLSNMLTIIIGGISAGILAFIGFVIFNEGQKDK